MTRERIQSIFAQAPASFRFLPENTSKDKPKLVGKCEGAVLELVGQPEALTKANLAVVLHPDYLDLARRNGILLSLFLMCNGPHWEDVNNWVIEQMRTIATVRSHVIRIERKKDNALIRLLADRSNHMATLTVKWG